MRIKSTILELNNTGDISVDYIESQIAQKGVKPLRWAIVKIDTDKVFIGIAYVL